MQDVDCQLARDKTWNGRNHRKGVFFPHYDGRLLLVRNKLVSIDVRS